MCVFSPALYRSHTQGSGVQWFRGLDAELSIKHVFTLKSRQVSVCYAPHVFSEVRNGAFGIH